MKEFAVKNEISIALYHNGKRVLSCDKDVSDITRDGNSMTLNLKLTPEEIELFSDLCIYSWTCRSCKEKDSCKINSHK